MSPKPRAIVAAVGALIYAPIGVRLLLASMVNVVKAARDYAATASGGIGAASASVDVLFLFDALLVVVSIVVNRMLARWARQSGGNIKVLHRTQRWSIVLAFVVATTSVVGFPVLGGPLALVLLPLGGAMWGVQLVLTAALLGTYATKKF